MKVNLSAGRRFCCGMLLHNDYAVQSLIAKGADVKATDAAGSTTLMWAATSETADTKLVDKLLQLGVDPNASNKSGETALAWALRRGHTPVVEFLRAQWTSDTAIIRQSVGSRAIALLQKCGPEFVKVSGAVRVIISHCRRWHSQWHANTGSPWTLKLLSSK